MFLYYCTVALLSTLFIKNPAYAGTASHHTPINGSPLPRRDRLIVHDVLCMIGCSELGTHHASFSQWFLVYLYILIKSTNNSAEFESSFKNTKYSFFSDFLLCFVLRCAMIPSSLFSYGKKYSKKHKFTTFFLASKPRKWYVLSMILKGCVQEFMDCPVYEIAHQYIEGEPLVMKGWHTQGWYCPFPQYDSRFAHRRYQHCRRSREIRHSFPGRHTGKPGLYGDDHQCGIAAGFCSRLSFTSSGHLLLQSTDLFPIWIRIYPRTISKN